MNDFDRDRPLRPEMRGAIDLAHTAFTEELIDLVFVIQYVHDLQNIRSRSAAIAAAAEIRSGATRTR